MTENRHSKLGIHGLHAHQGAHAIHRLRLLRGSQKIAVAVLAVLGLGSLLIIGQRTLGARTLAETAHLQSARYVTVVNPKKVSTETQLRLPGTLQGLVEAPIYTRSSGYLTAWYKDIGESVKQGELLARIDTPEIAQQLQEAQAAHAQALANLKLTTSTLERWENMGRSDAIAKQEVDERRNAHALAIANEAASAAGVKRLQSQLDQSRITAPFAGIVTKRNIDVGNLIDAGSGTKLLFVVTKSDPLRVFVQVPQNNAAQIKAGDKTSITLQEWPDRVFTGSIVRTARAIDTLNRTLLVEISLPNPSGELLPGAYCQVAIESKSAGAGGALLVPGNTLLFRPEGPRIAVVEANNKVRLQPVSIRRELGVEVELSSGLKIDERIVVNPADALNDGDEVVVQPPAKR